MKIITDENGFRQGKISDLPAFIDELIKNYEVIAPVKHEGKMLQFDRIISKDDIDFKNFPQSQLSFKEWFLPNGQVLLKYQFTESGVVLDGKINPDIKKRILFGLHSCDIHALKILDSVFLEEEDTDTAYKFMRDNTIVIGVGCNESLDNCFCGSMDTMKPPNDGYGLFFYLDGEKFYVKAGTDEGAALLKQIPTSKAGTAKKSIDNLIEKLSKQQKIKMPELTNIPKLIGDTYGTDFWTELGKKCFGCAGCTIVCPTCYCFVVDDIVEENGKKKMYKRVRNWDSCTLTNWALAAGGHNFQPDRGYRLQKRFMHKFSQIKEKTGKFACVGCGRCIAICPTGASNPVTVITELLKSN
ncbi:MAG: 4Fe-4S dicluster domain-containing protein [Promethearchaeota archaeon]